MPQSFLHSMSFLTDMTNPQIQKLNEAKAAEAGIEIYMLRLDQIHPVISGNKFFKLFYYLEQAIANPGLKIKTFGGAFSNHLPATAFACNRLNIPCIGIIRGGDRESLSPTLRFCIEQGMNLQFISRQEYASQTAIHAAAREEESDTIVIPEGGFSKSGAAGASLIHSLIPENTFSHICVAAGTGTTMAGLLRKSSGSTILGFPAIRNMTDLPARLELLDGGATKDYEIISDYHFGGYAKKDSTLIRFLNDFYEKHGIPLDFVYTGKMMFGIEELLLKNHFPSGSKILCIHTGGLQGNVSIKQLLRF